MAEAALFGIAKSVLQQLGSPALDEFRLLWGYKEQLGRLEDTVATIADVLEDADRRQATDVAVKRWIARLRVALYDADDLFDLISVKVLQEKDKAGTKVGKEVRRFLSKPYHFAFIVKTAHRVKEIRENLDAIARDKNQFSFLSVQAVPDQPFAVTRREQTHSYVPKDEVVGREQEKEDIVKMLLSDESSSQVKKGVSVIAVIGIGGLGKTTLAQLVYNDERVQKGFDLCVWTCVNYLSDLKQVLVTLLKSATKGGQPKDQELDQLQYLFRKEIEGKRFLLVLDDVWDNDRQNWNKLRELLKSGRDGSMVLATTRSGEVAQSVRAIMPYFHLKGVSDDNAWLLFKKIAFEGVEDQFTPELQQLGEQIVKKCANVPLIIVTIARMLICADKNKFLRVNEKLSRADPDLLKQIMNALELSYKDLPYQVKRCFGFCSLFPKDYEFEKSRLVHLWIAQGFVDPSVENQSLEDTAEEYFFCLVERCFFQNMFIDSRTKEVTCRMHDLMHDLAKEVSRCEIILVDQIVDSSFDKNIRHVSVSTYKSESIVDQVCSFPHSKSLRTFLSLKYMNFEKNTLNKLISSLRSLRVLDLSFSRMVKVPTLIGELIHLRFLDLSSNQMKRLPNSICSLRHLQSLNLRWCVSLNELPEDLGNLRSLRHLLLKGCLDLSHLPGGLIALTSLVTLEYKLVVHSSKGGLQYLEHLDNLSGSLEIVFPETEMKNATTEAKKSFLSRKDRLRALSITCGARPEDSSLANPGTDETLINALQPHPNLEVLKIKNFNGKKMVQWVMDLRSLVILKLKGCRRCVEIPPLSHLQSLRELNISDMSSLMLIVVDDKVDNPNVFFPSLEILLIENMSSLTGWWVQEPTVLPSFPRATEVGIHDCPKLKNCMPLFPVVEDLSLQRVREELMWHAIVSEATCIASQEVNNVMKRLKIWEVEGLISISESRIRRLSALQTLRIEGCKQLETVCLNGLAHLQQLKIKEGKEINILGTRCDEEPYLSLGGLEGLKISNLSRSLLKGLRYMTSLKTLKIYNSFDKDLQEEDEERGGGFQHLQKLEDVLLVFGETFSNRSNQRLLNGFQHLTSLQTLTLSRCKELYLSWSALLGLNHLRSLDIYDIEKWVDVDSDDSQIVSSSIQEITITSGSGEWVEVIPWNSFPSLEVLRLGGIRELEGLPEGIQHLAALQRLFVWGIDGIVSLPYWMTSLSSLQQLWIWDSSSELKKRCERLKGEDWPHIQHIPDFQIICAPQRGKTQRRTP